jgi:branched-chain amino acid transport system ATP-binding protein
VTPLLALRDVTRSFGGLRAVNNVTLVVPQGRIMGLIGPNGAGKTTLVNLITGMVKLSAGQMWFKGARIDGYAPHRIARLGVSRTFQIVQPFPEMTALENVTAAAMFAGNIASQSEARDFAAAQLDRVGLLGLSLVLATRLSLGQRKRLEFAKSLAMKPSILLLDEVNAGLHGGELSEAIALIRGLAQDGITILIIEHLMKVVISLCDDIAVLHHGELIANGPAKDVMADEHVIKAYLGERYLKRQRAG